MYGMYRTLTVTVQLGCYSLHSIGSASKWSFLKQTFVFRPQTEKVVNGCCTMTKQL